MHKEIPTSVMLEALVRGVLESGSTLAMDGSFDQQIGPYVDQDSSEILSPEALVASLFHPERPKLLDFGCGLGGHRTMLESFGFKWRGVNYKEGMADQIREQASSNNDIDFYNGLHLPYADESFDVVYSFQTFEHIQDIGITFSEIARVLKPGGALTGSVSYLEQIHDYSTFNFTPYGLKLAAEAAGMKLVKVYPSYDVFTWFFRRLLITTSASDENSLSDVLDRTGSIHQSFVAYGLRQGLTPKQTNLMRLMFSACFTFLVTKLGT